MISARGSSFKALFFIVFILLSCITCTHEANLSGLPEVCFTGDVLPIFLNNCSMAGCHDGTGESDYSFRNYQEIMAGIKPGNSDKSPVYQSLILKWGERMPPDRPLPIGQRMKIRIWIDQGAMETTCSPEGGGNNGGIYVKRACFSRDILPVIVSHCATSGCHDAITHAEGYNFNNYTNIRNSVVPGNPGSSRLYRSITTSGGEDKMPPTGKPQLTTAQVDSIRKWITYGALNENCGEVCDTTNQVTFSGVIWPLMQTTCTGCHSGSAPSGNISLSSYTGVQAVASNGLLLKSIRGEGVTRMPPSGSLSACRIRQFELWIKNGYSNN